MKLRMSEAAALWARRSQIDLSALPTAEVLDHSGWRIADHGVSRERIVDWERRFGFDLPDALKLWLEISDGLDCAGPCIHPLRAIGPMVPFARTPGLVVQPESWFELGNPFSDSETICVDLAYRHPDGDFPIFVSGDDERGLPPKIIADGFAAWLLRSFREGGRPFWSRPEFHSLRDPWLEHRRLVPVPSLPMSLHALLEDVRPLMRPNADDRQIASRFGISLNDVEALFRHLQHA